MTMIEKRLQRLERLIGDAVPEEMDPVRQAVLRRLTDEEIHELKAYTDRLINDDRAQPTQAEKLAIEAMRTIAEELGCTVYLAALRTH